MREPRRSGLLARLWTWLTGHPTTAGAPPESSATVESSSRESTRPELPTEAVSAGDRILQERDEVLDRLYRRNLRNPVRIETVQSDGLTFFDDAVWPLTPRFNLLLGRNGYGKSLLLRSLVAMLKRDDDAARDLLSGIGSEGGRLLMQLRRTDPSHVGDDAIVRDARRFAQDVGEVPMLAIPDSRFTDRSVTTIQAPPSETDLLRSGARNFLDQTPYQGLVNEMLLELCLDYQEHGGLDAPVFEFLSDVVSQLSEEPFTFEGVERTGRIGFRIFVRPQRSAFPLPIQAASQGTLSILAIFGIIRSFLKQLSEADGTAAPSEQQISRTPAIVFIDELDAHLHPIWQQRIRMLLTDCFPNVQFVVSSHSPLLVAGCDVGEVAVLRRSPDDRGYRPEVIARDFIGTSSSELYRTVFDLDDDVDSTYLRYRTKLTQRADHDDRLEELSARSEHGTLDRAESAELDELLAESQILARVAKVSEVRDRADTQAYRIMQLESQVEQLERELRHQSSGATDA